MSSQYYAIGNTAGYNVAAGLPSDIQHVKVLLAGCGDIMNLLATVAGLQAADVGPLGCSDSSSSMGDTHVRQQQQRKLSFVLNDGNISMLARDAVMLHMIAEQQASPEAVLAVWANHALTDKQHALVLNSCRALAEQPWPAWLSAAGTFGPSMFDGPIVRQQQERSQQQDTRQGEDGNSSVQQSGVSSTAGSRGSDAERAVRSACAAWCACTLSLKELLQERENQSTSSKSRQYAVELSLTAAAASLDAGSSSSSSVKVAKKLQRDITQYIQTGSLQQGWQQGTAEQAQRHTAEGSRAAVCSVLQQQHLPSCGATTGHCHRSCWCC